VGLIARTLEAAGISTVSLSSARSITAAANPPRAVFLDYPLGQTAGRAGDPDEQDFVMNSALSALEKMSKPGAIETIGLQWSTDHSWKDAVMRVDPNVDVFSLDDRTERFTTPQYERPEDAVAVESDCKSCVFFEKSS
tara:strand:- start:766 stop:1179 length:414 start_codon:yes stop_codon:yes gene_type:complete